MSLFPEEKGPLSDRLVKFLKRVLPVVAIWFIIYANFAKLALMVLDTYFSGWRSRYASGGHDLFWFFWLALSVSLLYLLKKFSKGDYSVFELASVIGVSLLIYVYEVFVATKRFIDSPEYISPPWSLYLVASGIIFLTLLKLPERQLAQWKDKLDLKDYLTILNTTRTFFLQVIGGGVLVVGLYYTAQNMSISQENIRLTLLRQESDRLNQAIAQLKDENPEVRIVAIYNLQNVAPRSLENYKLIVDILTRYVRTNAAWKDTQAGPNRAEVPAPPEIQAILDFLSNTRIRQQLLQNDPKLGGFEKSMLPYLNTGLPPDFTQIDLRGIRLIGADMNGWILKDAHLEGAKLAGAHLQGADLDHANLSRVDLKHADLTGANLKSVNFDGADLQETLLFDADLEGADFTNALNLSPALVKLAKNYAKAKLPPDVLSEVERIP